MTSREGDHAILVFSEIYFFPERNKHHTISKKSFENKMSHSQILTC